MWCVPGVAGATPEITPLELEMESPAGSPVATKLKGSPSASLKSAPGSSSTDWFTDALRLANAPTVGAKATSSTAAVGALLTDSTTPVPSV